GRLKTQTLPAAFWKTLTFHPDFDADPWLTSLRHSERPWAKLVQFTEPRAGRVLVWLRDVRRFTPADLGFDWLLSLAARADPRYHDFAVETLIQSFVPADFAATSPKPTGSNPWASSSFLFSGKLATIQRKDAEDKVRAAGGT